MTGAYIREGGSWVAADRPWWNVDGVWVPVNDVYVRDAGTWKTAYHYDVTPPDVPTISLELEEFPNAGGRRLQVGIRMPNVSNDPDVKFVRVLSTYLGAAPTSQYGGQYTAGSDSNYPDEPWSEWSYNGYRSSDWDSSEWKYKQWPRNATSDNLLPSGTYYFTAWSCDWYGNWSVANAHQIWVPKASVTGAEKLIIEARYNTNETGTAMTADGSYTEGNLIQQWNPKSKGMYFYGPQISNGFGNAGVDPTIRSAQIRVTRAVDNGEETANIYLAHHTYNSTSVLPASTNPTTSGSTYVGTLAKGQTKWFDIPESMWDGLTSKTIKGFALLNKDPDKAAGGANDYSEVVGMGTDLRAGEVHVVWTENP